MNDHKRREIFARFQAANPEPHSDLIFHSPFELLISVILSAQATDRQVNLATAPLFAVANTPRALLDLGLDGLKEKIRTINLYPTKAKNIMVTCRKLVDEFESRVPDSREALESLPGVGRKTANVILNIAFGQPTIAVDTHVFRVANRTGIAPGKTPLEVEQNLLKRVPAPFRPHAHHWLILHGRYTCKARAPECSVCLINDLCPFPADQT